MIEIDQYIAEQRQLLSGLEPFVIQTMKAESTTLLNKVKQRVRTEGLPGESYSEGYSAFRKKKGRQTSKVDLNFTGRMLNNTQIRGIEATGQLMIDALIGPSQQGEKQKLSANIERYGNVLKPNEKERREFAENYTNELLRYLTK